MSDKHLLKYENKTFLKSENYIIIRNITSIQNTCIEQDKDSVLKYLVYYEVFMQNTIYLFNKTKMKLGFGKFTYNKFVGI